MKISDSVTRRSSARLTRPCLLPGILRHSKPGTGDGVLEGFEGARRLERWFVAGAGGVKASGDLFWVPIPDMLRDIALGPVGTEPIEGSDEYSVRIFEADREVASLASESFDLAG